MDAITGWITEHIVLSGIGVVFIINILQRIVSDDLQKKYITIATDWITKIFDLLGGILYGLGEAISLGGRAKMNKVWEKIEDWLEHSIDLWVYAIANKLKEKYPKGVLVFLYEKLKGGWNYDNGTK